MTWQKVGSEELEVAVDELDLGMEEVKQLASMVHQEVKKRGRPAKQLSSSPSHDPVNRPAHYTVGGIETIDYIEAKQLNYHLGNVVKYVSRAGKKGATLEDLKKAKWYLDREIQRLEKPSE